MNFNFNWKELSTAHKIVTVISGIALVLGLLDMTKSGIFPFDMSTPAIAVFTICEAILCWKERRKMAFWFLAAGVVSLACFILELLLLQEKIY